MPGGERGVHDRRSRCSRCSETRSYAGCLVAQLWGGFYVGYFMALTTAVGIATALARPATRRRLADRLRPHRATLALAVAASALLLTPLAGRYLAVREISQRVGVGAGESRLPRLASYF